MSSAKTECSRQPRPRGFSKPGQLPGLKPRIHADELGATGARGRGLGRGQIGRPPGARRCGWHRGARPGERGGDALAGGGLLPETCALRAGARPHCRGRAGGARNRHEPGRRTLAGDALRDRARLLRHGDDVRGSPRRSNAQRGLVAGSSDRVGSLEPGKLGDFVVVAGDPINLVRVGAPSIVSVFRMGQ